MAQKHYLSLTLIIFNILQSIFAQIDQNAFINQPMPPQGGGFNPYAPPPNGFPGNNNYGGSQFPVISCPSLFSYQHDPSLGGFYGLIITPKSRFDTEFDVEVNMTINKAVAQSDNIKLNVLSNQDEIFHGESIKWSVKFPYQDVLPKLTQIKFNRMVICSNHPDPLVSGITQTSMWAKATIRTSAGASEPNPGGQMQPQNPGMGYPGMQPNYPPGYGGYGGPNSPPGAIIQN